MNWILAAVLILLLFTVVFTVQNYETVSLQFLFWSFQTSKAIIIFSSLIIGVIIGWVVTYIVYKRNW